MTRVKYKNSTEVGSIGQTDQGSFEVLSKDGPREYKIRFLNTGFVKSVRGDYIQNGSIKDPYFPSKYGVGYLGVGPYGTTDERIRPDGIKKKASLAYSRWNALLARCYYRDNNEYCRYGALGVFVNKEWHNFQVFAEWFYNNYTEGLDLDKDILIYGNKEYAPDTCCFVPKYINNVLVHTKNISNGYPVGVYYLKPGPNMVNELKNPFMVEMEKKSLGTFENPHEAHKVWQIAKSERIFKAVLRYADEKFFDTRVADALLSRAWKLKLDAQLGIETHRL